MVYYVAINSRWFSFGLIKTECPWVGNMSWKCKKVLGSVKF